MWVPPKHNLTSGDLLATTGDYLRLWNLSADNVTDMKGVLNNNKHAGDCLDYFFSAPAPGQCSLCPYYLCGPMSTTIILTLIVLLLCYGWVFCNLLLSYCTSHTLTEYCAPLTSFDWNDTDPSIIGTCSIDTTCTIWDINVSAHSLFLRIWMGSCTFV